MSEGMSDGDFHIDWVISVCPSLLQVDVVDLASSVHVGFPLRVQLLSKGLFG